MLTPIPQETSGSLSQCHLLSPEAERQPVVHFIKQCWEDGREIGAGEGRATDWRKKTSTARDV